MRTQLDLDEFIPTMDTPDKVYQLFESLGFKVLDSHLKTNPSVYNLPAKEAALVEKIYAVSNYDRRFQILLFKLKEENKEAIRTIPEKILREVDFPFIIFTPDFKTYIFTLVEKVREGPGEFKRKLTKLVIDSAQPYHTDKEILTSLALSSETKNPVDVYKLFQSTFSVEKVTKKFFTEYREVFERLVREVTRQNKHLKFTLFSRDGSIENFVKILLGRLMFLYFIQKRGWLNCFDGWGSGDKKFLYNKFQEAKKDKKNYFKDYLEPLFFDTLNNPRRDKPDQATQFGGRIPFLNGGLFEPDYKYNDPSEIVLIDNDSFEQVFSVFEKYNFTVKEDEPLEKEVAIDPEMLGKVFENLLEENLRKGKGTYYTPREIVHYMCHESLINYLASEVSLDQDVIRNFLDREQSLEKKETLSSVIREKAKEIDEKLADIKVLDPACGSGAFLVGMLHEVINARLSLNRELGRNKSEYQLKKEAIQDSLYGVDIDPGAVEIAKLRLWLSLVVDYNLPEIEPLPNLDYKIMVGNSLIELLNTTLLSRTADQDRNKLIEELNITKADYSTAFDMDQKRKLREKINSLVQILVNYDQKIEKDRIWHRLLGYQGQTKIFEDAPIQPSFGDIEKKLSKKLDELDKLKDVSVTDHFEWHLNFNEVFKNGGFDVVIANPPYVKEYVNKSAFNGLRTSPYYQGKMDLWYVFVCRGLDLLKRSGVLCFIAQNNWVTSYGASRMRDKVISDAQILSLIDFGEYKIFEAGIQTMVMVFKKDVSLENYSFDYRRLQGNDLVLDDILALLSKSSNNNAEYLNPKISRASFIDKTLTFSNSGTELILEKIRSAANFHLDPVKEVAQGIVCPQDYVIKSSLEVLGDNFKIGDGIFVLSDNEVKTIRLSEKELELIKPYYTTNELQRWYGDPENRKWIIYTNSSFRDKKKVEDYPSIKTHLDQFKKVITSDNKPYGLHRARVEHFFMGEKVIALRKCTEPTFTYTDFDTYVSATFYVIKTERMSQKYLTGLLNSNLIAFWLRHKGKRQGNNYQIDKEPIIDLPILEPSQSEQKEITNVVDQIINATKIDNENFKVYELEKKIDQLVYKLYGLTPEEIAIVEGGEK
ncbi:MAG: Eco57I restriction endonuclease family protein [Candidatus Amesbacteria bacterium GW2011_GWB1_47_26]|uniref:site-specific DNA-methyltransferase (adenine-specific) n=1 Tax=Candidatus Amesbacteria bacterium GW2011_GWC2_45_19 TaxID=1618366 RepID=A0A0G1M4Q3_9BACT|nr:MAG: Eco57I restriction endonuclease family protein [Candidatus Amesbacteria bacterium GW2011_GWC2_45_19]KKU38685.1 MAG: Eco57I restriction endonuclease family protein [Candidatus Amesbacteria bacterium GW2011_GWA1_46_35]KKU68611.1 MAG: Eco57I restriction endonuclease family protein [Microgenomates group bacterium GW2011_GWC1_47_20]KKU75005.1 MAG: Eco57I restriction endonuclease family protein [Candidatus Amesbacteria bacterium GW2011_GWB1_47_26]KKU79788.1 MAG: Eco57I restriction endonucleas